MAKDHAILDLSNPKHRAMLISHIKSLKGKHWVEIRKCRKQRTLNQNAYYWSDAVLGKIRDGLEECWGELLTKEETHEFLKDRFNSTLLVDRTTGEIKGRRPQSTADLDTATFAEYLNKVIRFAGEELGIEVPPADTEPMEATRG